MSRALLPALLLFAACSGGGGANDAPPRAANLPPPPNVVLVMADDLGYGDLGCYGSALIATPRIDAMAAAGARFEAFYAQSACTPTRASLLTGRYSRRLGMTAALGPWSLTGLDPEERTVGEVLRAASYRTGFFGKWHVGDSPDQLPTAQGFDEFAGLPWGPTGNPVVEIDSRSGSLVYAPDPVTQTERATTEALDFIARSTAANPDRPFLCVLSYAAPHDPAAANESFRGRSLDGRDYGDAVEEMDAAVGTVLDFLDGAGLGEDTLVLLLSDNGARVDGDPQDRGSNGVLRGGKGSTLEGGVRVPAVLRWTGQVAPGSEWDFPLHVIDVLPSLAALARAPLPPRPLDGIDAARTLAFGEPPPAQRVLGFSEGGRFNAVRRGRYKLREGELFDVRDDPSESTDLLPGAGPVLRAVAQELAQALDALEASAQGDSAGPAPTSRFVRRWSPTSGPAAPAHSDGWSSTRASGSTMVLVDEDPAVSLVRVPAPPGIRSNFSTDAYVLEPATDGVRWERAGGEFDPMGPFTVTLRYLLPAGGAAEPMCLLDVGDAAAGLSLTVGDAGIVGDDPGPGRLDDLRVCVGGSLAGAEGATLTVDLPDGPRGAHITLVRDADGAIGLHVDGQERATAPAPPLGPVPAGLSGTWSLCAPSGELGAAGSPAPPFPAQRSAGTFGEFVLVARALTAPEVSLERCRHLRTPACFGRPNSTGHRAELTVGGSLLPEERGVRWTVTDGPAGTTGVLMASASLDRAPFGQGYLCLGAPVRRFAAEPVVLGTDGAASFVVDGFHDLPQLSSAVGLVNVQFAFVDRDASGVATSNTTNVVRFVPCVD